MDSPRPARPEVANCLVKEPFKSMSRRDMALWFIPVSVMSQSLEELSTGVVYCHLLAQVFPGSLDPKKLKTATELFVREKLHNWKIFQLGIASLNVNKDLCIEKLAKPNIVEALQFCRWWIAFYSFHQHGPIYVSTFNRIPSTPRSGMTPRPTSTSPYQTFRRSPRRRLADTPRPRTLPTRVDGEEEKKQKMNSAPIRIRWDEEEQQISLTRASHVNFPDPEMAPSYRHVTLSRDTSVLAVSTVTVPQQDSLPDLRAILPEEKQLIEEMKKEVLSMEPEEAEEEKKKLLALEEYVALDEKDKDLTTAMEALTSTNHEFGHAILVKREKESKGEEKRSVATMDLITMDCLTKHVIGWVINELTSAIIS